MNKQQRNKELTNQLSLLNREVYEAYDTVDKINRRYMELVVEEILGTTPTILTDKKNHNDTYSEYDV